MLFLFYEITILVDETVFWVDKNYFDYVYIFIFFLFSKDVFHLKKQYSKTHKPYL